MEPIKSKEIDPRKYLRVLLKRKWIIISVFTVTVLVVLVNAITVVPLFKGAARIVIEKRNPNLVSIQEVMALDAGGKDYLETQLKIITSRVVATKVIRRLDLENNPDLFPKPGNDFISNIKTGFKNAVSSVEKWIMSLIKTESSQSPGASENAEEILSEIDGFHQDPDTAEMPPLPPPTLYPPSSTGSAPSRSRAPAWWMSALPRLNRNWPPELPMNWSRHISI
jgi:uncharacterized protein involved in exopolysaccharide biosynthesis